jgi:AAA ATPase domain
MDKMRVTIENLGAVKHGTFEIKPLTVFIGPNNSGKTWAAYGISSIFSNIGRNSYRRRMRFGNPNNHKYPKIDALINELFDKGNANIDIVNFFGESGISYFNNVARFSSKWMNLLLATDNISLKKLSITIDEESNIDSALNELLNLQINYELSPGIGGESIVSIHKEKNDPFVYLIISETRKKEIPEQIITSSIYDTIFQYMHKALYSNVRYLPAERTGVVALLASETNTSEKSDDSITGSRNVYSNYLEFSIPLPIKNMINLLSIIKEPSLFNSTLTRRVKDNKLQKIMDLANILEREIMGGVLEFEEKKFLIKHQILVGTLMGKNVMKVKLS